MIPHNLRGVNIDLSARCTLECPMCSRKRKDIKKEGEHGGLKNNREVFVLDHDHDTGEFRGHICNTCNSGLGFLNDDLSRLKNAVKYLEKFKKSIDNNN